MATEDEGLTVTLSFNMRIFPLDEHPVADDPHHPAGMIGQSRIAECYNPGFQYRCSHEKF